MISKKRSVKKLVNPLVLTVLCLLVVGCPTDMKDVYAPADFYKLLKSNNWIPLPIPDSKFIPGSIIRVTEKDIRWIDDLTSCDYPLPEFLVQGYIPNIAFSKKIGIEASAMISIKEIEAGPEFKKVKKVKLELTDHGADALRIIRLQSWMQDPNNRGKVKDLCMSELLKPDTYLVTEVMRVSKGKYTLLDENNIQIKVTLPTIASLLKIDPDLKYEITADGSLVIEKPVCFAVRNATRVGDGFETLGGPESKQETADAKIEKIFLEKGDK
jgi:hypothetical protein